MHETTVFVNSLGVLLVHNTYSAVRNAAFKEITFWYDWGVYVHCEKAPDPPRVLD